MAIKKVGPGPGMPPPSEGPKISSTLAKNVGDTQEVVLKAALYHQEANLSNRCSFPFEAPPKEATVANANMLRWRI